MKSKLVSALKGVILASVKSILITGFMGLAAAQAAPDAKLIDFWNDNEPSSALRINYQPWAEFLAKHVITNHPSGVNRIDFENVSASEKASLEEFLNYMQEMDPRQLNPAEQKAYWLNLYNATVVNEILNFEPSTSMREFGRAFWRRDRLYIAMQDVSLDDIEHGVLRPIFQDPRVHFAFFAGTVGSGQILAEPFMPENVEDLLEQSTKNFINHPRGVSQEEGDLVLSQIFRWYSADFGGNFQGVKSYISRYLEGDLAAVLEDASRASYEYNWKLSKP